MPRKARSARGVIVDFDLMKIKEQIASAPTPLEVKLRQDFIENRVKRRLKKAQTTVKVESTAVEADPKLPEPSTDAVEEDEAVDSAYIEDEKAEEKETKITKKKTTKQKARPTKTEK